MASQRHLCRVLIGAEHRGYVTKSEALDPALGERALRLPFEIDDDEVIAREEDLAQVIVAVDTEANGVDPLGRSQNAGPRGGPARA